MTRLRRFLEYVRACLADEEPEIETPPEVVTRLKQAPWDRSSA